MFTAVKVIARPKYLMLTIIVALIVVIFAAWLPNLRLVTKVITSSTMTLWQKTSLLTNLLGSLQTSFTPLSRTVTIISAILTGIQISLLVYYISRSARIQREMGMSFIGVSASLLGVGCASCGSVVLTSLIGFSSAATMSRVFPLKGQEFGIVGIAILLVVISLTIKKIKQPFTCQTGNKKGASNHSSKIT